MLKEFKDFALKGNVVDLAIGFLIGGGVTPIAKSLIEDIIMPPVGLILGRVDFSNLYFVLLDGKTLGPYASRQAAKDAGAVIISYGAFINTVFSFLIVAFVAFMIVKGINTLRAHEAAKVSPAPATHKDCPHCLSSVPLAAKKCAHCTSDLS